MTWLMLWLGLFLSAAYGLNLPLAYRDLRGQKMVPVTLTVLAAFSASVMWGVVYLIAWLWGGV
jgi:hypothetical protein